jgi:hypothetical protein
MVQQIALQVVSELPPDLTSSICGRLALATMSKESLFAVETMRWLAKMVTVCEDFDDVPSLVAERRADGDEK